MMASCGATERQNDAIKRILTSTERENSDSDFEDLKNVFKKSVASEPSQLATSLLANANDSEKLSDDDLENSSMQTPEKRNKMSHKNMVSSSQTSKPKSSDVGTWTVHCTSCGKQVNHHNSDKVKRHKHLGVLVCQKCYKFYGDGDFTKDENGSDEYCRWCAQGGNLIMCDNCHNAFCKDCIRRNFGRKYLAAAMNSKKWACYICDSDSLSEKTEYCEIVLEYCRGKFDAADRDRSNCADDVDGPLMFLWEKACSASDKLKKTLSSFKANGYLRKDVNSPVPPAKILSDKISRHVTALESLVSALTQHAEGRQTVPEKLPLAPSSDGNNKLNMDKKLKTKFGPSSRMVENSNFPTPKKTGSHDSGSKVKVSFQKTKKAAVDGNSSDANKNSKLDKRSKKKRKLHVYLDDDSDSDILESSSKSVQDNSEKELGGNAEASTFVEKCSQENVDSQSLLHEVHSGTEEECLENGSALTEPGTFESSSKSEQDNSEKGLCVNAEASTFVEKCSQENMDSQSLLHEVHSGTEEEYLENGSALTEPGTFELSSDAFNKQESSLMNEVEEADSDSCCNNSDVDNAFPLEDDNLASDDSAENKTNGQVSSCVPDEIKDNSDINVEKCTGQNENLQESASVPLHIENDASTMSWKSEKNRYKQGPVSEKAKNDDKIGQEDERLDDDSSSDSESSEKCSDKDGKLKMSPKVLLDLLNLKIPQTDSENDDTAAVEEESNKANESDENEESEASKPERNVDSSLVQPENSNGLPIFEQIEQFSEAILESERNRDNSLIKPESHITLPVSEQIDKISVQASKKQTIEDETKTSSGKDVEKNACCSQTSIHQSSELSEALIDNEEAKKLLIRASSPSGSESDDDDSDGSSIILPAKQKKSLKRKKSLVKNESYRRTSSSSSEDESLEDNKLKMQLKVVVQRIDVKKSSKSPRKSKKEISKDDSDYFENEIRKLKNVLSPCVMKVTSRKSDSASKSDSSSNKKDVENGDGSGDEPNGTSNAVDDENCISKESVKPTNTPAEKDSSENEAAEMSDSKADSPVPEDMDTSDGDSFLVNEKVEEKTVNDIAKETLLKDSLNSSADENENGDISEKDKKKIKKESATKKDAKSSDSSDSDFVVSKKKSKVKIKDKLLTEPLGDGEKKSDAEDGDTKPKEKRQAKKKRKVLISDDDDDAKDKTVHISSSSDTDDSSSDKEQKSSKKKQGKKRKRIKVADSSEDNTSDPDKGTPNKGRKNIRKLISDNRLKDETKAAAKAEEERRRRVAERQKLYNQVVHTEAEEAGRVKKLVLEINPKTKEELVAVHPDLASQLKPHQVNGVRFMWDATIESLEQLKKKSSTGCILAHSMGLGKTLQVITYLQTVLTNKYTSEYIKTALVICPYNTVLNWANEFNEWLNTEELSLEVYEISTIKDNHHRAKYLKNWQQDGGVLIIGYNMFRMLADEKRKRVSKKLRESFYASLIDPGPDVVVCDEGHLLKNESSAISKAVSKIKSLRRIILTGTPLQNNLKEYHCMVQFVKPHLLGTRKEFQNRFVNPIVNGQCADSTPTDFKLMKKRVHILHKLLEGCVQRCDYNVLTPYLPPKHEYIVSIRLSENQVKLYLHYLENFSRGRTDGGSTVGASLFKDYNVLKDIWTHPYLLYLTMTRKSLEDYDSMEEFIDDSSSEMEEDVVCLNDDVPKKSRGRGNSNKKEADEDDDEEDGDDNSGDGEEVVKKWKTRRGRGEVGESSKAGESSRASDEEDTKTTTWWNEFVTEKDETSIEMSGKLVVLFSIIRECELIGDKLLLFSQSLPTLNLVEKMLAYVTEQTRNSEGYDPKDYLDIWIPGVDYFRMDGSTNVDSRRRCIEAFNDENDRARLFMISTKAGSLGTNLVGANRVIILDASWNPTHDVQAIFRVFRFGQHKPVYVYRLLAQGTMEEKIYDRQVNKQSLSCRVIDEQQIERHFNASDLQELYTFDPESHTKRPTPMVPKDRLLAEMLIRHKEWIVHYHEHDSLLQNMPEEDLTEEERKAAWAEYEAEKEGLFQRANVFDMQGGDMGTNLTAGARINVDLAKIIENIKKQKPDVTQSELNTYLYNALVMLRSEYQQFQMNLLRQKHQLSAEGKPAPTTLLQQLYQMGTIIFELGRIMQELRSGVPASASLAQQVHQQQFNRRGRPPTSMGIPVNITPFGATPSGGTMPPYRMATPTTSAGNINPFQQAAFLQNLATMRQRQNMAGHVHNQNNMSAGASSSNWIPPWQQYSTTASSAHHGFYNAYNRKEPIITEVGEDEPSVSTSSKSASNNNSSVIITEVD